MRCRFRDARGDRGSITAEFVITVPVVMVLLATCLGGIAVVGQQIRLQDAAAAAAREAGRGSGVTIAARLVPGSGVSQSTQGELACVTVSSVARVAALTLPLVATSCALGGGR